MEHEKTQIEISDLECIQQREIKMKSLTSVSPAINDQTLQLKEEPDILIPLISTLLRGKRVFFNPEEFSFKCNPNYIYNSHFSSFVNAVKIPINFWKNTVLKATTSRQRSRLRLTKLKRNRETVMFAYISLTTLSSLSKQSLKIQKITKRYTSRIQFIHEALNQLFSNGELGKIGSTKNEPGCRNLKAGFFPLKLIARTIKVLRTQCYTCSVCIRLPPCEGKKMIKLPTLLHCSHCNVSLEKKEMLIHRTSQECGSHSIIPMHPCACYPCIRKKNECLNQSSNYIKSEISTKQENTEMTKRFVELKKEESILVLMNQQIELIIRESWNINETIFEQYSSEYDKIPENLTREFYIENIKKNYRSVYVSDLKLTDLKQIHETLSLNKYTTGTSEVKQMISLIRTERCSARKLKMTSCDTFTHEDAAYQLGLPAPTRYSSTYEDTAMLRPGQPSSSSPAPCPPCWPSPTTLPPPCPPYRPISNPPPPHPPPPHSSTGQCSSKHYNSSTVLMKGSMTGKLYNSDLKIVLCSKCQEKGEKNDLCWCSTKPIIETRKKNCMFIKKMKLIELRKLFVPSYLGPASLPSAMTRSVNGSTFCKHQTTRALKVFSAKNKPFIIFTNRPLKSTWFNHKIPYEEKLKLEYIQYENGWKNRIIKQKNCPIRIRKLEDLQRKKHINDLSPDLQVWKIWTLRKIKTIKKRR